GDGIGGDWRNKTVREIHLRSRGHAGDDWRVMRNRQAVPSDMRNLHRSVGGPFEAITGPGQEAKALAVGGLLTAAKQPLQPEADAEQGPALCDACLDRGSPPGIERRRGSKVADAG